MAAPICAPLKEATVFQSELKAIELAGLELQNIAKEGDIVRIFVDSQAVIRALEAIEIWQWHSFPPKNTSFIFRTEMFHKLANDK